MSSAGGPYLSIVVTARNDDHGGNLLARMQAFVSGWIAQAGRFRIPSELIVVEWNPPEDRPKLRDALRWPADMGPCDIRFIEVPREIHQRYAHAETLPLYQMIGKNVGIRRARGKFILATNIDILFSSELAAYFAEEQLRPECMYRIDRHDVMSDVPVDAPIEEQLAWCRSHLIRLNAREGTFPVTPDGMWARSKEDLAAADSGVVFGRGWYALEKYTRQEPFRWAGPCAELLLEESPEPAALVMDLEPGPGTGGEPLDLEVSSQDEQPLADARISGRCRLRLPLRTPLPQKLLFKARNGGQVLETDPRELNFRVFRVDRDRDAAALGVELQPAGLVTRLRAYRNALDHAVETLATGGDRVPLMVPVSGGMRRLFQQYLRLRPPAEAPLHSAARPRPPVFLHTNACGDFTLMAREHWFDLRGYAELDLFSMNLDSLLCAAAHHGGARETVFAEPMRIYHIEHGTGSGWTPEGQARLFARLLQNGIPYLANDEVLRWSAQMNRLDTPMIFNHENWGMADVRLEETGLA